VWEATEGWEGGEGGEGGAKPGLKKKG